MGICRTRDALINDIEAELKKDASGIDLDFIDRRIDELYALDGLAPPKLQDEQLQGRCPDNAGPRRMETRNTPAKRALKRRAVSWSVAACFTVLFLFSANYVSTMIIDTCLPSKVGIKI
jgi:hypothetical protein